MRQRTDSVRPAASQANATSTHPRAVTAAVLLMAAGVLAVLQALRAKLAAFAPGEALAAMFRGQLTDARAQELGSRAGADVVLGDATTDLPLIADAVIAGEVPGFGPAELCFTVDLAVELATRSQSLRREQGAQAGASVRKSESMRGLSARRTELYALLSSVTPSEGAARDAFERRARVAGRGRHHVIASLDAMAACAQEMLARASQDAGLQAYYGDKSFTAERVQALVEPAAAALRDHTAHAGVRAKVSDGNAVVDRVEGRLRDELMRLRQAVEAQRAKGVSLPEVALRGIRNLGASRANDGAVSDPQPAPPAPPVTPTPDR